MRAVLGVYYAVVLASENDNNFEEARWPIFFLRFGARLRCGLTCNWFNDGRTRTITAAGYVRSFDRTTFCDVATFVKCDVRVRFSKAPSISATVSKQRCRILHCRMLLRHCCWCGRGLSLLSATLAAKRRFVYTGRVALRCAAACCVVFAATQRIRCERSLTQSVGR